MKRAHWIFLILLGLAVAGLAARLVWTPGYMDADYYFTTARELAWGRGFRQPFLWNYLDAPQGLPHASHLYWLPLSSILSAVPMLLLGVSFRVGQLPFVLLTAALPAVTAAIGYRLTRSRRQSLQAGVLAAFPGFFLPFFVTTDSFSLYALLGGVLMLLSTRNPSGSRIWLFVGILIGLASLTRADGLLLFLPAALAWRANRGSWLALPLALVGFGVVVAPWWCRNFSLTGSPFGGGAGRVFWLTTYDDLFAYPPDQLTLGNWLATDLEVLVGERVQALGVILQRIVAENGVVFLGPFMALGLWKYRTHTLVRMAVSYLAVLLLLMVLIFPAVGARGAWFHSSAAMMPVLWASAPVGLVVAIRWLGAQRQWNLDEARLVLSNAAVSLAVVLTVGLAAGRLAGGRNGWGDDQRAYLTAAQRLERLDPRPGLVAVNNPPGWYLASGVPAVVLPNGGPEVLRSVIDRYEVDWVILEANHPQGLSELYRRPDSTAWLKHADSVQVDADRIVLLFQVENEGSD